MPARDRYHNHVRLALINDGWRITHDPLCLQWGLKDMYVDLGVEQIIAAEKGPTKIAVEIKSFGGLSEMDDLEKAVGQFVVYHDVLSKVVCVSIKLEYIEFYRLLPTKWVHFLLN